MIEPEISNLDNLEKLANDLKKLETKLLNLSKDTIFDFEREIRSAFENSIESYVYNLYNPIKYERTGHLKGEHGGVIEEVMTGGRDLEYSFEVDGGSRDPVDGTTWDEKAYKLEHGGTLMSYPKHKDRPFVDITANAVESRGEKLSNRFIREAKKLIEELE